jgi:FdhD protein
MKHLRRKIWKWHAGSNPDEQIDDVAAEEPLEIRVAGKSVSVTLRTPGHDDELAAGFLVTEGIIKSRADLIDIAPSVHVADGDVISITPAPGVSVDFDRLTRHVFASSSCGLCGKASIAAVRGQFPPVTADFIVDAPAILDLPDKLRAAQDTFARTGGLHAAGLFDLAGNLITLREDVGRHNAVDKVIGRALLDGLIPLNRHVLMVSGRTSFEIMQKALAGGLAMVAAVSAPSSLAVDFAQEAGQTLVGFLREGRMNIYAHPQRIRFPKTQ